MSITTMKLSAEMAEGFKTNINCSHPFTIDQPKPMGGNDEGPNPLEIFLSSLPACICALGRIISNQNKLGIKGINVDLEADIDKDYLLGKTDEGRAGFTEIRVFIDIDANISQEEKESLVKEISRRCPVADNIINMSVLRPTVHHDTAQMN